MRNAVDESVALGLEAAIDHTEENAALWTGVLAGEGTVFCAGADLNSIAAGRAATLHTARGGFAGLVARSRSKPLIAAVEGPALAGGAELVLACDLVVASRRASFGLPEVKRSLVAAGGGAFRTSLKLPRNVAMELLLTGSPLAADRAHHFGLVNVLTEEGNAVAAALELASGIGCNAPLAVRGIRVASYSRRPGYLKATLLPPVTLLARAWSAPLIMWRAHSHSSRSGRHGGLVSEVRYPI